MSVYPTWKACSGCSVDISQEAPLLAPPAALLWGGKAVKSVWALWGGIAMGMARTRSSWWRDGICLDVEGEVRDTFEVEFGLFSHLDVCEGERHTWPERARKCSSLPVRG